MKIVLPALLFALVWGYFADLRHGDVAWFILRIIFIPALVLGVWRSRQKNDGDDE
ncbi:MAG: hypothetical protein V4582_25150 [Pseudomonadota bacterium]